MKVTEVKLNKPKNKQAALNQAVYILDQIDVYDRRKENIMNNKKLANEKISRLEKVLQEYDSQLETINTNSSNWKKTLEDLKLDYSLTEAEILELKSSLLREKIQNLKLKADIQNTGKTINY